MPANRDDTFHIDDSHEPQNWLRRLHNHIPFVSLPNSIATPIKTKPTSKTTCAATTQKAVDDNAHGLNMLFHSNLIWERCWSYIRPDLFEYPGEDVPRCLRVWDTPGDQPPPSSHQQAIEMLQNLLASPAIRDGILLSTNSSAKEVVDKHIYPVLNAALKLRYKNEADQVDETPFKIAGQEVTPQEAMDAGAFYPTFLPVLRDYHDKPAPDASGYADKLLRLYPRDRREKEPLKVINKAVGEGKTPWTYSTEELEQILSGHISILNDRDKFVKRGRGRHGGNTLLKQVWGQCDSLGPDVGFVTNLERVVILIRYPSKTLEEERDAGGLRRNPDRQNPPPLPLDATSGFVVSKLMKWDDPRLITCLIGLCYMAIDEDAWKLTIQEMLCPEVAEDPERHRIRHAQ